MRRDDHKRVSVCNQQVLVDIVAVDNPALASEELSLYFDQFVMRHANPAGAPTVEVKMDEGEARLRRQLPRKCALPSTCHTGDNDATRH